MDIDDFIKEKLQEKKNDSEICSEILEKYENDIDIDIITEKIYNLKKIENLENNLKEKYKKEKEEKKINEEIKNQVDSVVNDKLKTININELNRFKNDKTLKRFNVNTKKFEDRYVSSECMFQFNNMLRVISEGDKVNAKAISKEIKQENKNNSSNSYKTMVSDSEAEGGYTIPTEINEEIMQLEYEKSSMLPYMSRESIIYEDKLYPLMYGMETDYIQNQQAQISEKSVTFLNPTVDMKRIGLWSNISNTILRQKGVDLTQAFSSAVSSAFAEFLDQQIVCGSINPDKDLVQGIAYDPNTNDDIPAVNLAQFSVFSLQNLKDVLDVRCNKERTYWICNQHVADKIGLLKNGDNYIFNGYIEGRVVKPFGMTILVNPQITNTFDLQSGSKSAGTSNILLCTDLSKVAIGLSDIRIDESSHFNFTKDMTTFRAIRRYGQKVLMSGSNCGDVSALLGLI